MRVNREVWSAAVENRPQLITQFRMYHGGSNKESALSLVEYGLQYGFIVGRTELRGKTLVGWSSKQSAFVPPRWAGITAAHYILANGFAGNEDVVTSAIAHLLVAFSDMSEFEVKAGPILNHLNQSWLSELLVSTLEKTRP